MKSTLLCFKKTFEEDTAILPVEERNESESTQECLEHDSAIMTIVCIPSLIDCVDDLLRRFNGRIVSIHPKKIEE